MSVIAYYERLCQEDIEFGDSTTSKRNPGGGTLSATQVSLSSLAIGQAEATASWTPGVIANQSKRRYYDHRDRGGAGDKVLVSLTTLTTAACSISAYVSAKTPYRSHLEP